MRLGFHVTLRSIYFVCVSLSNSCDVTPRVNINLEALLKKVSMDAIGVNYKSETVDVDMTRNSHFRNGSYLPRCTG